MGMRSPAKAIVFHSVALSRLPGDASRDRTCFSSCFLPIFILPGGVALSDPNREPKFPEDFLQARSHGPVGGDREQCSGQATEQDVVGPGQFTAARKLLLRVVPGPIVLRSGLAVVQSGHLHGCLARLVNADLQEGNVDGPQDLDQRLCALVKLHHGRALEVRARDGSQGYGGGGFCRDGGRDDDGQQYQNVFHGSFRVASYQPRSYRRVSSEAELVSLF